MSIRLALTTAIVLGAATAASAPSVASLSSREGTAPATLAHAAVIRADTNTRYRNMPGREPIIAESTTTGTVDSLTLVGGFAGDGYVVPASNGIYYALCPTAARCTFGSGRRSWAPTAYLPRRLAVEIALRTLDETTADLVVVSLPTATPVWLVFERAQLLDGMEAIDWYVHLRHPPGTDSKPFRKLLLERTRPALFVPLPVLPPPPGTIYALHYFA
jgi:hypothetical protein